MYLGNGRSRGERIWRGGRPDQPCGVHQGVNVQVKRFAAAINEGFIIDWASGVVTERPSGLQKYEVSFYVRYANRLFHEQTEQLAYVISYETDPATGEGYVYLPGKTDERYRLNTKAIYRGREGNWFRANAGWQSAVRQSIGHLAR